MIASLRAANRSDDPAMKTLIEMGAPAVPHLIREFRRNRSMLRRNPSYRKFYATFPVAMSRLLARPVSDDDLRNCAAIAWALGAIGQNAYEASSVLIEATQDPNESIRLFATQALGNIGPAAKGAVPAIAKVLSNTNYLFKLIALRSFALIGEPYQPAIDFAKRCLGNTNGGLRIQATLAVWRMEPSTENFLAVSNCLTCEDPVVRSITASHLGFMGSAAKPLLPVLEKRHKQERELQQVFETAIRSIK